MPYIEYLGFVVRQQEKEPEDIIAACIAKFQAGDKKVWKAYPLGGTQFIPMLFITSVFVRETFAHLPVPESGMPRGKVLLKKPNSRFDFILSYLSDVWRKRGKYEAVYDDLRNATRLFFCPHGKDKAVYFEIPEGGMHPSQFFFWTVSDFLKKASLKELPITPTDLNILEDTPQSNQDILPGISELAEKVRRCLAQPTPWQQLYKKTFTFPEDLPEHQISLSGSIVESNETEQKPLIYKEQNQQLSEMLAKHKKILLTGPSGCGKTTVQKMLMAKLLGSDSPIKGGIPIFVPLKYIGVSEKNLIDLVVDSVVDEILKSNALKSTIQQQIDLRRARQGEKDNLKMLFEPEVREFFASTDKKDDSTIVLFLDGYNEISEAEVHDTDEKIRDLSEKIGYIVVSSHSYCSFGFQPAFVRFELQELSDEQIISHLNDCLEGKGEQFFDDKLSLEGRVLSMARIPFYLELIVEYHLTYPERKLPTCCGPLLKFFVQKQYKKKEDARELRFPGLSKPEIDFFLRKLAYTLIDKGKGKAQTVLRYPDDLSDVLPLSVVSNPSKIAQAAELIGFLDKSGQKSEEPGAPGIISFKHDNIRDYFAAQEFKNQKVLDSPAIVKSYLEYTKWDNVWLMMFGFIDDEIDLRKALSTIAQLDPIFASYCLTASPIADKKSADFLLNYLDLSRISILTERTQPGFYSEPFILNDYICKKTSFALSNIFSLYPVTELLNLYSQESTNQLIKTFIPDALVYAVGDQAIDYFEQIYNSHGLESTVEIFDAVGRCRGLKAYRLLADANIRAAERGSEKYKYLASCLWNFQGYVPIEVLLEFEESYYRILEWPSIRSVIVISNPLLAPLAKGLSGNADDWVRLRNHPDSDISTAARMALFITKHPTAIEDIVNDCKAMKPKDFGMRQSDYYQAFVESGEPGVIQSLFQILEQATEQNEMRHLASTIIPVLLEHKDETTVERLVKLGLNGKDWLSLECLSKCLRELPKEAEQIVRAEMLSKKLKGTSLLRAHLALAKCGDETMKPHMMNFLNEIVKKVFENPHMPEEKKTLYQRYFTLLCDALLRLKVSECKPTLKKVANSTIQISFCLQAHDALKQFDHQMPVKDSDIAELIEQIKSTYNGEASIESILRPSEGLKFMFNETKRIHLSFELLRSLCSLPIESYKTAIVNICEIVEAAIGNGDKKLAQCFYFEVEKSRTMHFNQRFLDIFAGWPTIPAKYQGIS